jgi:hypothetical protein
MISFYVTSKIETKHKVVFGSMFGEGPSNSDCLIDMEFPVEVVRVFWKLIQVWLHNSMGILNVNEL